MAQAIAIQPQAAATFSPPKARSPSASPPKKINGKSPSKKKYVDIPGIKTPPPTSPANSPPLSSVSGSPSPPDCCDCACDECDFGEILPTDERLHRSTDCLAGPDFAYESTEKCHDCCSLQRIGPYVIKETIGAGATAEVKLAIHKKTGVKKAIKIIEKAPVGNKTMVLLAREIAVMKALRHPHVTELNDLFETDTHMYIVMPYIEGGALFDYLINRASKLPLSKIVSFIGQLLSAINYMHQHKLCHRDIKPENILISKDGDTLYVCDFGLSRLVEKNSISALLNTQCGSFGYSSPEQLQNIPYDGQKADMWAIGVIIYILASGQHPFDLCDGEKPQTVVKRILTRKFTYPEDIPADIKDLIENLLVLEPSRRFSAEEALKHPALAEFKEPLLDIEKELEATNDPIEDPHPTTLKFFSHLEWGKLRNIMDSLKKEGKCLEKVFYKNYLHYLKHKSSRIVAPSDETRTLAYCLDKCLKEEQLNIFETFITKYETTKEGLMFSVQVEIRNSHGWAVHTLRKKHSDFRKLHSQLKKAHPKEYTLSFPSSVLGMFASKYKVNLERKMLLNNWLATIVHHPTVKSSPLLHSFFNPAGTTSM